MESLTPSERSMRARIAAHSLHARYDSRELTAPARKAFMDSFERKAHYTAMALKSAQVRRWRNASSDRA